MADQISVDLIIKAISEGFDKLSSDVGKLGSSFQDSSKKVQTEAEKIAAAAKKTQASLEALGKQSSQLAIGFGAFAAAGAAIIGSSVMLAARVETLGVVTQRLGKNIGMTTAEVRALEQAIMKQGITLQGARQSIARMIQANIDLSKATQLARLAQDAAVIAGINSTEAFDNLITAISTGQVRILHMMGIQVLFEDGYKKMAEAIGKSTDALTEEERAQARVNIVLEAGKNIQGTYLAAMDTAGKKAASLARHIEAARLSLGQAWLPVYADAVDAITGSLTAWNNLDQSVKDNVTTILGLGTAIAAANSIVFGLINALVKARLALIAFQEAGVLTGLTLGTLSAAIILPVSALALLVGALVIHNRNIQISIQKIKDVEVAMREGGATYGDYRKAIEDAAKAEDMLINKHGDLVKVTKAPIRGTIQYSYEVVAPDFLPAPVPTDQGVSYYTNLQSSARKAAAAVKDLNDKMVSPHARDRMAQAAREQADFNAKMDQGRLLANMLSIALASNLGDSYTRMSETLADLGKQQFELNEDLSVATQKYGANSEKVRDLNDKLTENAKKQLEARDAMKQATAEMIYQQAAAGLDAEASLALAKSMGIISEADFAIAKTLSELRAQYDSNKDGLIANEEGAARYAKQVDRVNEVIQKLIDKGLPITMENIAAGMASSNTQANLAEQALLRVGNAVNAIPSDKYVTVHISTTGNYTDVFDGRRAAGGPVYAGATYWTGEQGPEPFVPAVNGRILSVQQAQAALAGNVGGNGGGGGGDMFFDFTINAAPGMSAGMVASILASKVQAAVRAANSGRAYSG